MNREPGDQFVRDSTGAFVDAESGFTYRGEVRNGTMNGTGTVTHSEGGKYEGEWNDERVLAEIFRNFTFGE